MGELTPETKDIIKKMKPETRKLLEDMGDETYKEIASEIISIARPMILAKCHRDRPDMTKEEASKIVKGAFGSRSDLPSGKDFVDEVRGHDRPDIEQAKREELERIFSLLSTDMGKLDNEYLEWQALKEGEK